MNALALLSLSTMVTVLVAYVAMHLSTTNPMPTPIEAHWLNVSEELFAAAYQSLEVMTWTSDDGAAHSAGPTSAIPAGLLGSDLPSVLSTVVVVVADGERIICDRADISENYAQDAIELYLDGMNVGRIARTARVTIEAVPVENTTANRFKTVELSVCSDCLFLVANGEVSDIGDRPDFIDADDDGAHLYNLADDDRDENAASRHGAIIDANWPMADGWSLSIGNDDQGFSTSRCDACGTRLHGDRYGAVAMRSI
jgi:hypothetical protein